MEAVKKFKLDFDLATNFDPELIHFISKYSADIPYVYGKLPFDGIGGGRTSSILPTISWKTLKEYVDLCHQNKIKFNYLFNAICFGNKEYSRKFHSTLIKVLDRLSDYKVDAVTVSSAYLCELIKKQYPHFKMTISVHCRVRTLQQIDYWTGLGADELTLFHTANRDFPALKKFLQYLKGTGVYIRVIGNNACLHECPFQGNHAAYQAHASRTKRYAANLNIDYQMLKCNNIKLKDPTQLIASEWIRPEDVSHYESLCSEVGNHNFSIKLTERSRTTEFLKRVVTAYMSRSYDGNLLDIINYVGNKDMLKLRKLPIIHAGILGMYDMKYVMSMKEAVFPPLLHIDNKKLDGFLSKFVNNYDCYDNVCEVSCSSNAEGRNTGEKSIKCSYCKNWSEKTITFDKEKRDEWIQKSDKFINRLKESEMFSLSVK